MGLFISIAVIAAIIIGMWFFLKVTYDRRGEVEGIEVDQENLAKAKKFFTEKVSLLINELIVTPIVYIKKFGSPEGRESFSIKEKWFTYAVVIALALTFVLEFYYAGIIGAIVLYIAIQFRFFGEAETKAETVEFSFSAIFEKVENYISSVSSRLKDEHGELAIYEYIILVMVVSIPYNIAEYLYSEIHLGWILLAGVLVVLLIVHLIELATGFKFTKIGEIKDIKKILKKHKEDMLEKEVYIAELEARILNIDASGKAKEVKDALSTLQVNIDS